MSLPLESFNDRGGYFLVYFISGAIWIPFTILICCLFIEQLFAQRYPQYIVMFFLAVGCSLRCIWFWISAFNDVDTSDNLIVDRLAILFQFSAVSCLILMWGRILKVSRTERRNASNTNSIPNPLRLTRDSENSMSSSMNSSARTNITPSVRIDRQSSCIFRLVIILNIFGAYCDSSLKSIALIKVFPPACPRSLASYTSDNRDCCETK